MKDKNDNWDEIRHGLRQFNIDEDKFHVYPRDDLREHILTKNCWCQPMEEDGVIVHNSLDERELYETGIRKPH